MSTRRFTVGLIADTHGLMRPEAIQALAGSDHLLHAGDIGSPEILDALRALAPLSVIRGNNDDKPWAADLPDVLTIDLAGVCFHMLHDRKELDRYPAPAGAQVIVAGHSHKPLLEWHGNVLHLNPGAAGRRRFRLPITVARILIDNGRIEAEHIDLLPT